MPGIFWTKSVWKKVLRGFREKYSSYGRFGGKVVLKNLKSQDIEEPGGLLWQVFSWTEKCDSVCREISAGTGSKPLQKYDTGMAVRKLFRRTIAWKTGTKTFKATGKRKNMGKFPKELRRNADRDGGRIVEKYRQRQ